MVVTPQGMMTIVAGANRSELAPTYQSLCGAAR